MENYLNIEFEDDTIAVLYDILFSFQFYQSFFLSFGPRTESNQIIVFHHFSFDESFLEIRMDGSCRLRCRRTDRNGPGFRLFLSRCEIVHQSDLFKT